MAYLFSYGTLRDKSIQEELFLRELHGWPDELQGFELSIKKAYGQYPVISKSNDQSARIAGMVYEVSNEDLKIADSYEGKEYTRILAKTSSGKDVWAYVAKLP